MISKSLELDDYDDLAAEAHAMNHAHAWCAQAGVRVYISHTHRCWEYASALRALRAFPEGMGVLDIGCGNGLFGAIAAIAGYPTLELDPRHSGKDRFPGLAVTGRIGGIADLPTLPPCRAVTCLSVMEHVPQQEQDAAWRTLARAVAPDGTLFVTVDYGKSGAWGNMAERDVCFNEERLRRVVGLLEEEGLTFGEIDYTFHGPRVFDYTFFRLLGRRPEAPIARAD